jgi:peptidoglycan/xylan/chitin deacetylase (PgdA/CDA1 family)
MNRREALRAAAAVGLRAAAAGAVGAGAATGCDSTRRTSSGPASPSSGRGTRSSVTPSGLPAEVLHGPRDRPNVALTFHGQGDPALAKRLLGELEAAGARATVLAVGSWLAAEPAMAKRVLDGGHELGNHTQNHLDITSMRSPRAFAEINECAQVLRSLTGSIGAWFRPSQTRLSTPTIQAQAIRVGYATCLSYDVDSLDNTDPAPANVVRNVLDQTRHGSIVSLHLGHTSTVTAMPEILDGLRARGLRAVTMSDLVG